MKAYLKNYRQSPRKVRLVAGLIKKKTVGEAIAELDFLAKRAGTPMKKLLMSAVANAKDMGKDVENLIIKELRVDKGVTLKRMMPAAMGSGHRINKRTSHILLTLGEKVVKAEKKVQKKVAKVLPTKVKKAKPASAKKADSGK
ncbi:MAG TPA: 50S ribosomal protein L22 [Candidatus Paceibacterota bacterium]|jgi:large subunit ribosomal protein L22|nr:50S ribosomal protein L22 [Candidatus Paceibacterota bacterium]